MRSGAKPLIICLLLANACATHMNPGRTSNPPPRYPLKNASRFELRELEVAPDVASREPKVVQWVQTKLNARIKPILLGWNHVGKGGRSLSVAPRIDSMKFISTGERFWAGAMAGGSAINMSLKITESSTGQVVANPIFYQHANAFGSGWTMGSTDREMLDRVVDLIANYLANNYEAAVGGATGAPAE